MQKKGRTIEEVLQTTKTSRQVENIMETALGIQNNEYHDDMKIIKNLKNHIKLLMNQSLKEENGKLKTLINSADIRSIAGALEICQRIQRLSAGFSTENIAVNGVQSRDEDIPIFEVQVNRNGKFENARPKLVRGRTV
jgi:hypothetical protein